MFTRILRAIFSFILDFIETIVIALAIFVVVYLFLFQPHQVKGSSMADNFHDGEYLLTDKITYRFRPIRRGEVIIFKAPRNEDYDYIKRVIALPHERVKISGGKVFVNGVPIDESAYLPSDVKTSPGQFFQENKEITIPDGEYFVLGDNRSHSSDSRDWGTVPRENIIGKAWFRYWPPDRIGLIPTVTYSNISLEGPSQAPTSEGRPELMLRYR